MKTLVIHPDDRTTDFLKPIYSSLTNATVLTSGEYMPEEMNALIEGHERVIMLGHGADRGLLSRQVFRPLECVIGADNAEALSKKENSIFVWCYADEYVQHYNLKGLSTGMFISELDEADMNLVDTTWDDINASNDLFARSLGEALLKTECVSEAFEYVKAAYVAFGHDNLVQRFNAQRWYCFQ